MAETAQKYELSFLRACRKLDISWGLQFLCIRLCRSQLKSMSYPFSENAERVVLAKAVFDFYALAYAGDCSKVWFILSQSMQKGWISWDGLQLLCISLCRRLLKIKKYELSFLKACRRFDIRWDSLRFLCISLGWRLLKSSNYSFSDHAERLILAETVFNFYAWAYAGDSISEHAE